MRSQATPGYEERDTRARPLILFALALVALTLVSLWISSRIFGSLADTRAKATSQHPMTEFRDAPEDPVLQANPTSEIEEHDLATEALLQNYAWIDPENGVVRIPIERAMSILVREGLPVRETEAGR